MLLLQACWLGDTLWQGQALHSMPVLSDYTAGVSDLSKCGVLYAELLYAAAGAGVAVLLCCAALCCADQNCVCRSEPQ